MVASRLHAVYALGQSIWYDNIRRGLIASGELQRLIDNDAVVGITSNPTIFEKAIDESDDYDAALKAMVAKGVTDGQSAFESLAIDDIQAAADVLKPIYDRTHGKDGYISLEVSPTLANDTKATIAEARRLWKQVERPNVMIKIPATSEGLPAIEHMISEGVNINVTLIFSLDVYEQVVEAYIRGLEFRHEEGLPVTGIASVASFFVSRVDTAVDALLDQKLTATSDPTLQAELKDLHGKAAIANAKLAYQTYQEIFHGKRFSALRVLGASPQRCLWASTSAKNPAYRDVMYVEELIGPETVDTMPPQTIVAFQDHGEARVTVDDNIHGAESVMGRLSAVGVDMAQVTRQLELDGVKSFAASYSKLIESTTQKMDRLRRQAEATAAVAETIPHFADQQSASLGKLQGDVDAQLDRADHDTFAARTWNKDASLWKADLADPRDITERLGWLTVADRMVENLPHLDQFREDVRDAGFTSCVLLGMGGSSLAPEVMRATFGVAEGQPAFYTLDSTDPATIQALERSVDMARTLFIVASKSGGTIETISQFAYFRDRLQKLVGEAAGEHFIIITDAGTALDTMAENEKLHTIFQNPADIGGRFAALSYFGLVPAAMLGVDLHTLLDRARVMARACGPSVPARENPGVWLGTILGTLARRGRDKVTFAISPPISTFGYWVEQLLAESTGKEGVGILPVEGEPLGKPEVYDTDRVFVYLRTDEGFDPAQDEAISALESAGQPVIRLALRDTYDLGQEFFRWEFATAIAGAVLGVNAFDQPNVQESKDNTDRLLQEYTRTHALAQPKAVLQTETRNISLIADGEQSARIRGAISLQAALEGVIRQAHPGDYIALLAYIQRTDETENALQHLRLRLRDTRHVPTTLGFGPRFQHSTGQLHKGGPNTGVFLQFVATDTVDVQIPDEPYSFGVLKQAQALGDLQSLQGHGRRVVRIDLGVDMLAGLAELMQALDAAQV